MASNVSTGLQTPSFKVVFSPYLFSVEEIAPNHSKCPARMPKSIKAPPFKRENKALLVVVKLIFDIKHTFTDYP
jgi:hypothetical protein